MMCKKSCGFIGLVTVLMLTGCGTEALCELTDAEQQLIVNYSAHVVSKFNRYQKDGLTYVLGEEEEKATIEDTEVLEEPNINTESTESESGISQEVETKPESGSNVKLDELYADTGLTISYVGYEIADTYMEDDVYALKPSYGKTFVILTLKVENLGDVAVTLDNLSAKDTFSLKGKMNAEIDYHTPAVMSLLTKDFITYEGTIKPQSSEEMFLIFEIPQDTAFIENPILKIYKNNQYFQINL